MTVKTNVKVEITATLTLTEGHLRALDALTGYGTDAFLKAFYVKLGKHYMTPFERDLRDLFSHLRGEVPHALREVVDARKRFAAINARQIESQSGEISGTAASENVPFTKPAESNLINGEGV